VWIIWLGFNHEGHEAHEGKNAGTRQVTVTYCAPAQAMPCDNRRDIRYNTAMSANIRVNGEG
jgi:hypothetical protein